MSRVDEARQLAARREFGNLEDLWTDLLTDTTVERAQFLSVADAVAQAGDTQRSALLLEMLAEYYETQKQYDDAFEVYIHMLRHDRESPQIRQKIIMLFRREYKDSIHLDDYLTLSGLNTGEPIMKALQRFEEYVKYDIGEYFFFDRYGLGEVVDVIPAKKEIVVDFEKKEHHFLTIDVARGLLQPVGREHFLFLKRKEPEKLRSLARNEPVELVVMLLRSIREPMPASKIKAHLEGVVEAASLDKFWEKTRKAMERHDNIKVAGKAAKLYSYVESAADKEKQAIEAFQKAKVRDRYGLAAEYARKMPQVFTELVPDLIQTGKHSQKDHPGIALEILLLLEAQNMSGELDYSLDDLTRLHQPEEILKDTTDPHNQSRFIAHVKTKDRNRWLKTATDIIFASDDLRVMDAVAGHMTDEPGKLTDIYQKILAMPREYPRHFLWILRKIETGSLTEYLRPNLIPKFIDSLTYVAGVKTIMKKILTLKRFDEVMARAEEHEAIRIRDSIDASSALTDHDKSGYLRIIEHYFPTLAEERTDIIYATEEGLARRKKELEHIVTVEIPANKKEIGRAREFGDLSENFEYKAAKERQDQLYARAKTIESELQSTRVIDPAAVTTDVAGIGTRISLQNIQDGSRITYTILGRWDTDLSRNIISNEAPLARAITGKKRGDRVSIEEVEYEITEIDRA